MDITREKELEASLAQQRKIAEHSARLASIGELAAGVGHEINNPLAIVMGNIDKIRRQIETNGTADPAVLDTIRKQKEAAERIRRIVRGLRSLAHSGRSEEGQSTDPVEALLSTVDLVTEIYNKDGVNVRVETDSCKSHVACSITQLQQIVMNLVSNAKDAAMVAKDPQITIILKDSGDSMVLSVQDNGHGISKINEPKIFSTFFTTKEIGKGTGLGLAITKSIVDSMGGRISFQTGSEGTTFEVQIPKAKPFSSSQMAS